MSDAETLATQWRMAKEEDEPAELWWRVVGDYEAAWFWALHLWMHPRLWGFGPEYIDGRPERLAWSFSVGPFSFEIERLPGAGQAGESNRGKR